MSKANKKNRARRDKRKPPSRSSHSYLDTALRVCRSFDLDGDPLRAEMFASRVVFDVTAGRAGPSRDLDSFIRALARTAQPGSRSLLRALSTIAPDAYSRLQAHTAATESALDAGDDPLWLANSAATMSVGCHRQADVFGDAERWILLFDNNAGTYALICDVDLTTPGTVVTGLDVFPDADEAVTAACTVAEHQPDLTHFQRVSPATAFDAVEHALGVGAVAVADQRDGDRAPEKGAFGPNVDDTTKHLVAFAMARLSVIGRAAGSPSPTTDPGPTASPRRLAEELLTDGLWAARGIEARAVSVAECVGYIFAFSETYDAGRVDRVSPSKLDALLTSGVLRRSPDNADAAASVLHLWATWALDRSTLAQPARDAVFAVLGGAEPPTTPLSIAAAEDSSIRLTSNVSDFLDDLGLS